MPYKGTGKHIISHLCKESKTAYCSVCGLNAVVGYSFKGNYYWRCSKSGWKPEKWTIKKQKLYRVRKNYCEICGFIAVHESQIDIHHKDHNHDNDEYSNLESQCANCHRLEHIQTYEELDAERHIRLLNRRQEILLNPNSVILEPIVKPGHKNNRRLSHKLENICEFSKTAFCIRCGLVSIFIRKDKLGFEYWCCNHGGKKETYGKPIYGKINDKKDYCENCGFIAKHTRQLDIHHEDGNHHNNEPSNRKTNCANCHRLAHAPNKEELALAQEAKLINNRWLALINDPQYHIKSEEIVIEGVTIQ